MEKDVVEEIVKERVKENERLFSEKELKLIRNNSRIFTKIYLLGLINGRDIYGMK